MLKTKVVASLLSITMFSSYIISNATTIKNSNINATNSIKNYISESNYSMNSAIAEINNLTKNLNNSKGTINNLINDSKTLSSQNYNLESKNENLQKELDSLLGKTTNFKTYQIQYNIKDSKVLYNNPQSCSIIIDYIAVKYLHVPSMYESTMNSYISELFRPNTLSTPPSGIQSTNEIINQIVESKSLLNPDGSVNETKCYNLINFILENDLGYQRGGIGLFTYSVQEVDRAIKNLSDGTYYGIDGIKRVLDEIFIAIPSNSSNSNNGKDKFAINGQVPCHVPSSTKTLPSSTCVIKNNNIDTTNSTVNYLHQSIISMNSAIKEINTLCSENVRSQKVIKSLNGEINDLNNENEQLRNENNSLQNSLNKLIGETTNFKLYKLLYNLRDSKALYNNSQNCITIIDYIVSNFLHVKELNLTTSLNLQILQLYNYLGTPPNGKQNINQLIDQIKESKVLLNPDGSVNNAEVYNLINFILENDLGYARGGGSRYNDNDVEQVDSTVKALANGTYFTVGHVIHSIFTAKDSNLHATKTTENSPTRVNEIIKKEIVPHITKEKDKTAVIENSTKSITPKQNDMTRKPLGKN